MVYKTLIIGNAVYKFHKAHGQKVTLSRSVFSPESSTESEPQEVERVDFESEEVLDAFMQRIIPMKQSGKGCSLVMREALGEVIHGMTQRGLPSEAIVNSIAHLLENEMTATRTNLLSKGCTPELTERVIWEKKDILEREGNQ